MGLTKERKMKYETQKKGYYVQLQKGKKSDTVSLFFLQQPFLFFVY